MNSVKAPVLLFVMIPALFAAGCASKTVKTEPTPPPAVQNTVQKTVAEPVAVIEVKPTPEIKIVKLKPTPPSQQRTVYFDYNSDELGGDSMEIITSHVDFLLKNPDFQLTLEGHADERGSDGYNQKLGSLRAQAIKRVLLEKGVDDKQVVLISYGEEKPAVMGNNDDAWQSNRRANFVYNRADNASKAKSDESDKMFASEQ